MSILAVDVGGTKVVCARVEPAPDGRLAVGDACRFASKDYGSLDEILAVYINKNKFKAQALGVGVAGPVVGKTARVTNLSWSVDAHSLAESVAAPVFLLNDLEALAYGLDDCPPHHRICLNQGTERPGNRALIAAGTGLGQALLFFDGKRHWPSASEGGHCAFAPVTADDVELWAFLRERYDGHVSWERVVSGLEGFRNLYDWSLAKGLKAESQALAEAAAAQHDMGAAMIAAAERGDALAVNIVRWFVRLFGAETGNLALKGLATGGVYIGGGIAPRILPWLQSGEFVAAMTAKGRFAALLAAMPVYVLTDPDLALIGAARRAVIGLNASC